MLYDAISTNYVYIINADLDEWRNAVQHLTDKHRSKNIRALGERFLTLIKMAGYNL